MKEYHLALNEPDETFMKRYVSCLVHQDQKTGQITEVGNYVLVRYHGNYDMAKQKRPKHGNTVEKKQNRKHQKSEELKRTHAEGATPRKAYQGSSKCL